MGAISIAKDATFLYSNNEYSNQTARMRRLISVFVGRPCLTVCFLPVRLSVFVDGKDVLVLYHSHIVYMCYLLSLVKNRTKQMSKLDVY